MRAAAQLDVLDRRLTASRKRQAIAILKERPLGARVGGLDAADKRVRRYAALLPQDILQEQRQRAIGVGRRICL